MYYVVVIFPFIFKLDKTMYKYIYIYSFLKFENKQKNTDNAQKIAIIKPLTMIHAVQKNVKRKWIQKRPEFF